MKIYTIKLSILVLCIAFLSKGYAQYTIQMFPPPPQFTFENVWNLSISGDGQANLKKFFLTLRVFKQDGTLILKSNSSPFSYSGNFITINYANILMLKPFTNQLYGDNIYSEVVNNGGYFPAGVYGFRFELFGKDPDGGFLPLTSLEEVITVEALFPPMLLSPYDEDTISNPLPVLTWTPAFTSFTSSSVFYSLRLAEVVDGQTGIQAILANPYLLSLSNLTNTVLPYPVGATQLQRGKKYAWQVHAFIGNQFFAETEVWTFIYNYSDLLQELPEKPKPYGKLYFEYDYKVNLIHECIDNFLRFEFIEYSTLQNQDQVIYELRDSNDKSIYKSWEEDYQAVQYGSNLYALDLCKIDYDFQPDRYYFLVVKDKKNQVFRLKFLIVDDLKCK